VAELVISFCGHDTCDHLETILKTQADKYDSQVLAHIVTPLHAVKEKTVEPAEHDVANVQRDWATMVACLSIWRDCGLGYSGTARTMSPADLLERRMRDLIHALTRAGVIVDEIQEAQVQLQDDVVALDEIAMILQDSIWQLREICHEMHRRWPELKTGRDQVANCIAQLETRLNPE
jgi:hypothetical protein